MNRVQFITSLGLAILFAILAIWGTVASLATGKLLAQQQVLQSGLENARLQQKILEQILQRTVSLGKQDPEILKLLKKYGIRVTEPPADPAPRVPMAPEIRPSPTPVKKKK